MTSFSFKVVLLGQGCVGKTSLVLRYVSNVFNESHESTLQASFLKKQLYLDQHLVQLNIWDTAGQEKFHALGPIYYREANGALLVYDVTSPDSLRKVRDWVRELNKMLGKQNVCLAIIGNKSDLLSGGSDLKRDRNPAALTNTGAPGQAPETSLVAEAVQLSEELQNARHYLTSAKLNQGIGEMFVSVSRRMIEQHRRHAIQRHDSRLMLASSRLGSGRFQAPVESNGGDASTNHGPRVIDGSRTVANATGNRGDAAKGSSCQC